MLVGAPGESGAGTGVDPASVLTAPAAGAAFAFRRTAGVWGPLAYVKASNTDVADFFGTSVSVSGDTFVVGAYDEDGSGSGIDPPDDDLLDVAGAAYVYR